MTFGNIAVADGIDSASERRIGTISSLIISLSAAALGVSLTLAAVISLIAWLVG